MLSLSLGTPLYSIRYELYLFFLLTLAYDEMAISSRQIVAVAVIKRVLRVTVISYRIFMGES